MSSIIPNCYRNLARLYLDTVYPDRDFYHHSSFKRLKYYRWIGWIGNGYISINWVCLGIFAYASGNFMFADYLNIMYIPNLGELSIFIGAMIGPVSVFCGTILTRRRFSWAIREA